MKGEIKFAFGFIAVGIAYMFCAAVLNFVLYANSWQSVSFRSKVVAIAAITAILIGLIVYAVEIVKAIRRKRTHNGIFKPRKACKVRSTS